MFLVYMYNKALFTSLILSYQRMSVSSFLLDDKSESRTLHTDVERTCRGRGCIGSGPGWGVTSCWGTSREWYYTSYTFRERGHREGKCATLCACNAYYIYIHVYFIDNRYLPLLIYSTFIDNV